MTGRPNEARAVEKGQWWHSALTRIYVRRVARDGSWADIYVQQPAANWSKRQPLPFPQSWRRIT